MWISHERGSKLSTCVPSLFSQKETLQTFGSLRSMSSIVSRVFWYFFSRSCFSFRREAISSSWGSIESLRRLISLSRDCTRFCRSLFLFFVSWSSVFNSETSLSCSSFDISSKTRFVHTGTILLWCMGQNTYNNTTKTNDNNNDNNNTPVYNAIML